MYRLLVVAFLAVFVVACEAISMIDGPREGLYPDACDAWNFPQRQCEAIVDSAIVASGIDKEDVVKVWLLPFEREVTLGGGQIALVGLELADGRVAEQDVRCAGIAIGPVCDPDAEIWVFTGVDRDVPCTGEAPDRCATLPPTPPPKAIDSAAPLQVPARDIPIDHAGRYEVEVGKATLANGYLVERSMSLVETQPSEFWIDGGVRLEVQPDDPDRPPVGSIYREPFDGLEPVTVFVVFDVTDFDERATLELRNIVVR
jgi:hypothetical protein